MTEVWFHWVVVRPLQRSHKFSCLCGVRMPSPMLCVSVGVKEQHGALGHTPWVPSGFEETSYTWLHGNSSNLPLSRYSLGKCKADSIIEVRPGCCRLFIDQMKR